jgi:hypothetical protein
MAQIRDPLISHADDDETFTEQWNAAENQVREELGELYSLVEMGDEATLEGLDRSLAIQERLDSMIDKCLKRLLFVRGLKSISTASSSPPRERLA